MNSLRIGSDNIGRLRLVRNVLLTFAVLVCCGRWVGAFGDGALLGAETWVAFSARAIGEVNGREGVRRELFWRNSDGSTRQEIVSVGPGENSVITIRNFRLHLQYGRRKDGAWAGYPILNLPKPPTLLDFQRPGVVLEPTTYQGLAALHWRQLGTEEEKTLVPELNYFPVENATGRHSERMVDIVIGPQPDDLFTAPRDADIRMFRLRNEMDEFMSGRR